MMKTSHLIIIGIVIVVIIIAGFLISNLGKEEEIIVVAEDSEAEKVVRNLMINLEWREPTKSVPTAGRFYGSCEDGTNRGKIWLDLVLDIEDKETFYTCKMDITALGETLYTDNYQLNLGKDRERAVFIGFANELAKDHSIEVCCESGDKSQKFCRIYELKAYC